MIEINKHFAARKTVLDQTPLVQEQNEQVVTTSLIVADEFEKRHDNVMKSIEGLLKNKDTQRHLRNSTTFAQSKDSQQIKCYRK